MDLLLLNVGQSPAMHHYVRITTVSRLDSGVTFFRVSYAYTFKIISNISTNPSFTLTSQKYFFAQTKDPDDYDIYIVGSTNQYSAAFTKVDGYFVRGRYSASCLEHNFVYSSIDATDWGTVLIHSNALLTLHGAALFPVPSLTLS